MWGGVKGGDLTDEISVLFSFFIYSFGCSGSSLHHGAGGGGALLLWCTDSRVMLCRPICSEVSGILVF